MYKVAISYGANYPAWEKGLCFGSVPVDESDGWPRISPDQMQDRLRAVDRSPIDSLYLCEEDGTVVGVLGSRIRENLEEVSRYGEISLIVVHEGARQRGIRLFIMEYAEKLAGQEGCVGTWPVGGFGCEEQAHRFYKNGVFSP